MPNSFDRGLTAVGRFFTVGKILFSVALTAATAFGVAYGVSFYVADYVTKASVSGLTTAVQNLQSSISDLGATVRAVDNDLQELRTNREGLAVEVANRIGELKTTDAGQAEQLKAIREGVDRLQQTIEKISFSQTSIDPSAYISAIEEFKKKFPNGNFVFVAPPTNGPRQE